MEKEILKIAIKNAVKEVLVETPSLSLANAKTYTVDILPRSDGSFIAWDPIKQQRIYKKGTTIAESWVTERDAKIGAIKFLKKKYPDVEFN